MEKIFCLFQMRWFRFQSYIHQWSCTFYSPKTNLFQTGKLNPYKANKKLSDLEHLDIIVLLNEKLNGFFSIIWMMVPVYLECVVHLQNAVGSQPNVAVAREEFRDVGRPTYLHLSRLSKDKWKVLAQTGGSTGIHPFGVLVASARIPVFDQRLSMRSSVEVGVAIRLRNMDAESNKWAKTFSTWTPLSSQYS